MKRQRHSNSRRRKQSAGETVTASDNKVKPSRIFYLGSTDSRVAHFKKEGILEKTFVTTVLADAMFSALKMSGFNKSEPRVVVLRLTTDEMYQWTQHANKEDISGYTRYPRKSFYII